MRYLLIFTFSFFCYLAHCQQSISLEQYVLSVVDYSSTIKQSEQSLEWATSNAELYKTDFLPSLSLSGDASYQIKHPNSSAAIKDFSYLTYLNLSQTVYSGGSIRANNKIAQLKQQIAQINLNTSLIEVIYSSELTYWAVAAAKTQLETAKEYEKIVENLYQLIQIRFNDGYIARTDLLMIETQLNSAKYSSSSAYKYYRDALITLNILMGERETKEYFLSSDMEQLSDIENIILPSYDIETHPSYKSALLYCFEQKENISLARSSYNPTFSVGARAEFGSVNPVTTLTPKLWGAIYASLSVPIFDWGARRKSVARARATSNIAGEELEQTRDDLTESYKTAQSDLVQTHSEFILAENNMKTAAENLDLQNFSYTEGKLPIIYVLQAQISWLEAYTNFINSAYNHKVAVSAYKKAVAM